MGWFEESNKRFVTSTASFRLAAENNATRGSPDEIYLLSPQLFYASSYYQRFNDVTFKYTLLEVEKLYLL